MKMGDLRRLAKEMGMPDGFVVDELPEGMKRREPLEAFLAAKRDEAAKALFAQLREMGVGCKGCKYDSHGGYLYSFCGETDWLGKHFYCGSWEALE